MGLGPGTTILEENIFLNEWVIHQIVDDFLEKEPILYWLQLNSHVPYYNRYCPIKNLFADWSPGSAYVCI